MLLRQILFNLAIGTIAGAILMRISAEHLSPLHGVVPLELETVHPL